MPKSCLPALISVLLLASSVFSQQSSRIVFPQMKLTVGFDGKLRKQTGATVSQNQALHAIRFLKSELICAELDLTVAQKKKLESLVRNSQGRLSQDKLLSLNDEYQELLLSHQEQRLKQVENRYRCIVAGIRPYLQSPDISRNLGITSKEMMLISKSFREIESDLANKTREAKQKLSTKILRLLSDEQLARLADLYPDSSDSNELWIEISHSQLSCTKAENIYNVNANPMAILGVLVRFEVVYSGELKVVVDNSPISFVSNLKSGLAAIGIKFDKSQLGQMREFELTQGKQLSQRTRPIGMDVNAGKLSMEQAKKRIKKIANDLADEAIDFFAEFLTDQQQKIIEKVAWKQAIQNRGLIFHLVYGELKKPLRIDDSQIKKLKELAKNEAESLEKMLSQFERRVWIACESTLDAGQKKSWRDHFGKPVRKLSFAPSLLLAQ